MIFHDLVTRAIQRYTFVRVEIETNEHSQRKEKLLDGRVCIDRYKYSSLMFLLDLKLEERSKYTSGLDFQMERSGL